MLARLAYHIVKCVITRGRRLSGTQQDLRDAAITKQNQDKSPQELSKRLTQHESDFAPREILVGRKIMLFTYWSCGMQSKALSVTLKVRRSLLKVVIVQVNVIVCNRSIMSLVGVSSDLW
jgi:hypothetical protein